jgi:signal transduction histidine kinase
MAPHEQPPGQILSLLSHELRSPLGVVRGYLKLLNQQQTEISDPHRQAVAAALKASDRCVDLLAQASALAQMWRRETPVHRQPIALSNVFQSLVQTIRTADDHPLPIAVDSVVDVTLTGDSALLLTALTSLGTAVHRAQPDHGIVHISARVASSAGRDGIAIEIAPKGLSLDTASGTPLDLRRGGLGLELPMAAAIVDAHRGTITERRSDSRMAVVVWLPTSEAAPSADEETS